MCKILKTPACQRENIFFFEKLLFLTWTSSNLKVSYATALKFSVKEIHFMRKKNVSAICNIMNIKDKMKAYF